VIGLRIRGNPAVRFSANPLSFYRDLWKQIARGPLALPLV
jgi:hypothetical protein